MSNIRDTEIGSKEIARHISIGSELADIADEYRLKVAREDDECDQCFAERLIEALADKIIELDDAIACIEELVPDAVRA